MIYFIPLPMIEINDFNKNLEKLEYQFRFKYINWEERECQNLWPETLNLMKLFDFDNHIQMTTLMF